MNLPTILFSILGWITIILFVGGLIYRLYVYAKTPMPLKIPINTPPTMLGVIINMIIEVTLFRKVFKTNKFLWFAAWFFHAALLLVILRHLRFFMYPVPGWVMAFYSIGIYAGYVMLVSLILFLARRFVAERNSYVSLPIDYYILFLLIGIAGSGLWMNYNARIYLIDVKAFILGLFSFSLNAPEMQPLLVIHILMVFALFAYFPFSKLLHAPGVFFSPTMIQRNDIEIRRKVNPWDYDVPSEPFYVWENFDEKRTDKHPEVIQYPPGWKIKVEYDKYKKGD